jgi:hypothetical protein
MNDNDRQAIAGLFDKLGQVERQAPPRDADAEAFINHQISQQPGAPYFMAQTIVMQDYALQQAQARIQQLEAEAADAAQQAPAQAGGGGLFGSLFGSSQPAPRRGSVPSMPRAGMGAGAAGAAGMGAAPMGQPQAQGGATWGPNAQAAGAPGMAPGMAQRGGGGFLAGAAQTAMGVAGGVLLGNALMGMFGGNEAQAATPAADQAAEPSAADEQPDAEPAAAEDDGGWFGGGGDSWFGGDEEI